MGSWLRFSLFKNLELKLISFVLALATVLIVHFTFRSLYPMSVQAKVEIKNLAENLVVANREEIPETVNLGLQVPVQLADTIRNRSFTALLNLSGFDLPGTYSVPYEFPDLTPGVVVTSRPRPARVRLERVASRVVEVRPLELGSLPGSLVLGKTSLEPELVKVSGPESVVERLRQAVVEVKLAELYSSQELRLPVMMELDDGQRYPPSRLSLTVVPAEVTYRVEVRNQEDLLVLNVTPELRGEVPAGYRVEKVTIEPREVLVPVRLLRGKEVYELKTEPVDLAERRESFEAKVRINYPFPAEEGLPRYARVSVTIRQLVTGELTAVKVQPELVGADPERFSYELITREVEVYLPPGMKQVDRSELRVVVDVSGLAEGEHRLPPEPLVGSEQVAWEVRPRLVRVRISKKEGD